MRAVTGGLCACFKASLCAAGRERLRSGESSLTRFICLCARQGLFRIAAGASKLKKLKAALDCSTSQLEEFYSDPHAVAGMSQTGIMCCLV